MDKLCVLMAAYNGSQYIAEQIESILVQENVDIDLFVRLDPSNDGSEIIIHRYTERYNNVFFLSASEPSGSAGQNFFNLLLEVDFNKYDYIAFADQDDIWFSKKLCRAVKCINDFNVDAYSGDVIAWWEGSRERIITKSQPQGRYDYLFESAGPGCTFVFKKQLAIEIKLFLRGLGQDVKSLWLHDWFCYAFARSRGFHWHIDCQPMMKYRQHDFNSVGVNSGFSAFKTRVMEVWAGEAFEKVKSQASILGFENEKPIQLLYKNDFLAALKLIFYARESRRRLVDKFFFIAAILVRSIGKYRWKKS